MMTCCRKGFCLALIVLCLSRCTALEDQPTLGNIGFNYDAINDKNGVVNANNDVINANINNSGVSTYNEVSNFGDFTRKRGTITEGLRAAAKLLKGADEVKTGPKKGIMVFRDYRKSGDFESAIRDFYNPRPENIRKFKMANGVEGLSGTKGDRNIFLINKGQSGRPEIEIQRYRNNIETMEREFSGDIIKRITYD